MQPKHTFQIAAMVAGGVLAAAILSGCNSQRSKPQEATTASQQVSQRKIANACELLTEEEIADVIGNAVSKGRTESSTDVCKWDTEDPTNIDVLLIARESGSIREQALCDEVRKNTNSSANVAGLGDIAVWKFSREGSLFNSGELEVCGSAKGYLSLTVQGKRDEPILKAAAITLAQKIWGRL